MSRLTRDGTAEPVSRDQILRHVRGQGKIPFPCSADHGQDWQPYPVDPYSAICDDHTYIHTLYYSVDPMRLTLGNPFNTMISVCLYSRCSHLNLLTFFLSTGRVLRMIRFRYVPFFFDTTSLSLLSLLQSGPPDCLVANNIQ